MKNYKLELAKKYSRPSYGDTSLFSEYNLDHFNNGFRNEYTLTFEITVTEGGYNSTPNKVDVHMNLVNVRCLNESNEETLTQEGIEILLEL